MVDLTVKDVALRLGENEILKGVSVAVPAGQVVALLGPSGSGKTTLLRAIAGLETPYRGSIAIGDRVFFDAARGVELPAEQRGLGLVFQSYALWPHRTVFDNVGYGLKLRGVSAAEIKTRVEKTLSQIGLGHLAARYPHQLSGGQQQRVAIARALVYEPPVILLDEPLSNLDAKLREEARAWLRTLIVTLGLSAIHVTHDQVEAMAIADRIVLLDAGLIAQEGPPTALYNEPATLFAAEFMGSNNRLDGKLAESSGGRAMIELFGERLSGIARTKAAAGGKATGIIRIERVRCASSPGPNRLKMELKAPMYLGERWELVFARETLSVRAYASAPLEPGEHYVEFPTEALWVF
ncbi:MAG TPA: ABC transporter ATP-binding protein [Pseudolabrys sp.]|nr:ABC transporter ATP-binding protein [Pseudolabrys sp.]